MKKAIIPLFLLNRIKAIVIRWLDGRTFRTSVEHSSFQSEDFIFRGGYYHDLPAPEVPHCCEMEGHVGEDH